MLHTSLPKVAKWALDLTLLAGGFCLAFVCRFEGAMTIETTRLMLLALPVTLSVKVLCWVLLGIPGLSWRYVSLADLWRIGLALLVAGLELLALRLAFLLPVGLSVQVPVGVLLFDLAFSLLAVVGARLAVRLWCEGSGHAWEGHRAGMPTLVIGAGRTGAALAREILGRPEAGLRLVGFLDNRADWHGLAIHGVPVLGSVTHLAEVARKYRIGQVVISTDDVAGAVIRRVLRTCHEYGIKSKVIPGNQTLIAEKVNLAQLRDIAIEDLLRREPLNLDRRAIAHIVGARRVLVTGAGGSIGSELCREICRFGPNKLVLVEQAENPLFHIHQQLQREFLGVELVPCVADICDRTRMGEIFATFCPEVVFHAAAHKHVPMMEYNPGEAVKNNILGTRTLADLAHQRGVGEFVMISTDKAVNPTSVMGASKRVAEIYVQSLSSISQTRFVTVRFGNVLGSNGSVVPIFKEQIARGGPVTVTHPRMKRYFMTIPEACQLVLQSASMGRGGEIFILDMGEPVKVLDLARDLIELSGLEPGKDIQIIFTGIRPGEKLFEELSFEQEHFKKTDHPQVFVGQLQPGDWKDASKQLDALTELVDRGECELMVALLQDILPEYQPKALSGQGPHRPKGAFSGHRRDNAATSSIESLQGHVAR